MEETTSVLLPTIHVGHGKSRTRLKMPFVRHHDNILWSRSRLIPLCTFRLRRQYLCESPVKSYSTPTHSVLMLYVAQVRTPIATSVKRTTERSPSLTCFEFFVTLTTHWRQSIETSRKRITMGVIVFVTYVRKRIHKPLSSGNQDLGVALALYGVYPAILWLLIDKFHGIRGLETYISKQEAILANKSLFL